MGRMDGGKNGNMNPEEVSLGLEVCGGCLPQHFGGSGPSRI